jgi:hypothetical protein
MCARRAGSTIGYTLSIFFGLAVFARALVTAAFPIAAAAPPQAAAERQPAARYPQVSNQAGVDPQAPGPANGGGSNELRRLIAAEYRFAAVSELRFVRTAASLSKEQIKQIAGVAAQSLHRAVAETAALRTHVGEGAVAVSPDPYSSVRQGVLTAVRSNASAAQWARCLDEMTKRRAQEKQAAARLLLLKLDRQLRLSSRQRSALGEALSSHWNEDWEWLEIIDDDENAVPNIPDQIIVPLLSVAQQKTWSDLARFVGTREASIRASLASRLAILLADLAAEFDAEFAENPHRRDPPREAVRERIAAQVPENALTDEQFDQWALQAGFDHDAGVAAGHAWLDSLLAFKLDYLDRFCGITAVQRKKLELAGRGDIKRFFDLVTEKRTKLRSSGQPPESVGQFRLECQQLVGKYGKEVFEEPSIFSKAIPRTLTPAQLAAHEREVSQAALECHCARVDLLVQYFDVLVGFRDQERRRLTEMLVRETRPLPQSLPGGTDHVLECMVSQAAGLPAVKFRLICDDLQWSALSTLFDRVHNGAGHAVGQFEFDCVSDSGAWLVDEPLAKRAALDGSHHAWGG